ncbi:methyltransferase domain-containing protein [Methylosinus sp. PW1]|uniref:methyltransferase domain-containing protein n=1 Tax=Methylosinus sp. PW1 TaxID=107636 RepID=UPI0005636622|nr:methyltransferase domain-containing protein [Methylosinus sp. PW1]
MYDELADIVQHRLDVGNLRQAAEDLGFRVTKYRRGIDLGGGLGLHAPFLLDIVEEIYITDIVRYTTQYEGTLLAGISAKFARNNIPYDPSRVEFHTVDAQDLIYRDGLFDFVFSVNAFEHIPEPAKAYDELIRVTAPGSLVLIQFDPLWHSAYGHHLFHLNLDPWAHLLTNREEFERLIYDKGGNANDFEIFLHEMNGKRFQIYRDLFEGQAAKHFSKWHFDYWSKSPQLDPYASRYPEIYEAARARGYDLENLLVRGVQFIGERS